MIAAEQITGDSEDWHRRADRARLLAMALSALLHLVVALALIGDFLPSFHLPEDDEPNVAVDLVPEPDSPTPPPVAPPPPASPDQPKPQLEPGKLAEHSTPGGLDKGLGKVKPQPQPTAPGTVVAVGRTKAAREGVTVATQSMRDYFLSQIIHFWTVPEGLRGREGKITMAVDVLADGTLGPPFSVRTPWNPAAAITGYDAMAPNSIEREVADSLYKALRDAQPLRMPPDVAAKAPIEVRLDFRPLDVP